MSTRHHSQRHTGSALTLSLCLLGWASLPPSGGADAVPQPDSPPLAAPAVLSGAELIKRNACEGDAWLPDNVPLFECPDREIEGIYYYRWRSYHKNILWHDKFGGWTVHEGGGYGITPCPLGHHLYEGRWIKNRAYLSDYCRFWFAGFDNPRRYSTWFADGCYSRYLVDWDAPQAASLLSGLRANYEAWKKEHFDAAKGLFHWIPDRDGMEASLAGFEAGEADNFQWKTVIFGGDGYRPSLNSYLFADAQAIAAIAALAGDNAAADAYAREAAEIKHRVQKELWSDEKKFFLHRSAPDGHFISGREEIGFFPWAFHLPDDAPEYAEAWKQLRSADGFEAKYGPTTLERRSPYFLRPFSHGCLWNGPSWPYSTSLTLAALANALNDYRISCVTRGDYVALLHTFAVTQHDPGGKPMVREDHHPDENRWLAQGADYNHSRYCDLVITGLVGLRPRPDDTLEVNPLAPPEWDYFCLDGVLYHGRALTILYDRTGARYHRGRGLIILVDNREVAAAPELRRVKVAFESRRPPTLPASLPPEKAVVFPNDLALNAAGKGFPEASASFTCPSDPAWLAIDGTLSFEDQPRNRWTCYGTPAASDWLAIDLGSVREIDRAVLWIYDDGIGVRAPASIRLQSETAQGWTDCRDQKTDPAVPEGGRANTVTFAKTSARKFRVVFTHAQGSSSGVTELALYGPAASAR